MIVNEKFVFLCVLGCFSIIFFEERLVNDVVYIFLVIFECCFIVKFYKVIKSFVDVFKF